MGIRRELTGEVDVNVVNVPEVKIVEAIDVNVVEMAETLSVRSAWQRFFNQTSASDTTVGPAVIAGIATYVTDLVLDNAGITSATVVVKDGTTIVFRATLPPTSTSRFNFNTALKTLGALKLALTLTGNVFVTAIGYTDAA